MLPELFALASPPPFVETCTNWLTVPEFVVLALPPALAKSWTEPLTVPELLMVAFWAPVVRAKLPLVPELAQVSVLPLVLHTNCARADDRGHTSDKTPETTSQMTKYDRGRSIGDGRRKISINEPNAPAREPDSWMKCITAARSKAKYHDGPHSFFVQCDKMAT